MAGSTRGNDAAKAGLSGSPSLIYVLLADRDGEIADDHGIHASVGSLAWEAICRTMETAFQQDR